MLLNTVGQHSTKSYDYSGTITTGGTAQVILPSQISRAYFIIQNISSTVMSLQMGSAILQAVISGGAVTAVNIINGGVGYIYAPTITFLGGTIADAGFSAPGSTSFNDVPFQAGSIAQAIATVSGGAITSVTVTKPGSGYTYAPFVEVVSDVRDPFGCAAASGTSGILLPQYGSYVAESSVCFTGPMSIWGATTGQAFTCKVTL